MDDASRAQLARAADLRSRVNEKLLKALIGLLAVKDEHLLDELRVVFEYASRQDSAAGGDSSEVWRGVNRQLSVLLDLASGESADELHELEDELEEGGLKH